MSLAHLILTRCSYQPSDLGYARRRRELFERVCARSLAGQTRRDFTWVLGINPSDPLLKDRERIVAATGVPAVFIPSGPYCPATGWWDSIARLTDRAATHVLTTRLDDDDALSIDFIERLRRLADGNTATVVWSFPCGYRLHQGRCSVLRVLANQFVSMQCSAATRMTVFDEQHPRINRLAPVRIVDDRPAWLWMRHDDTRSHYGKSECESDPAEIQDLFAVDWKWLGG